MAVQKQDDQHEHTFSSYVRIRDVVLKTYLGRWTIGRSGERGSEISVLPARDDDDDDEKVADCSPGNTSDAARRQEKQKDLPCIDQNILSGEQNETKKSSYGVDWQQKTHMI